MSEAVSTEDLLSRIKELEAENKRLKDAQEEAKAQDGLNYFCRQTCLYPFQGNKQEDVISQQTALILGCGGYGTNHAFALCRLGFKRIILVDYDNVEYHNLNRQMLFGLSDVGKSKVECAKKHAKIHNIHTEIRTYHGDAVKNWDKIVEFARQSTCIFTSIDVSFGYTYAVMSLGAALGLPVVYGGTEPTIGHYVELNLQKPKGPFCEVWGLRPEAENVVSRLTPDKILDLKSLDFIPPVVNPEGGSTVYSCSIGALIMVSLMCTFLLDIPATPNRVTFNMYTWETEINSYENDEEPSLILDTLRKLGKMPEKS